MPISLYRRRIAATVIQLAKDDPSLVTEVIARLRESVSYTHLFVGTAMAWP